MFGYIIAGSLRSTEQCCPPLQLVMSVGYMLWFVNHGNECIVLSEINCRNKFWNEWASK